MTKQEQFTAAATLLVKPYQKEAAEYIKALERAQKALKGLNEQLAELSKQANENSPEHAAAWDRYREMMKEAREGKSDAEATEAAKATLDAIREQEEQRKKELSQKAAELKPEQEAAEMLYNLIAGELLKIQSKFALRLFITFAGIFSTTNTNNRSKKAGELLKMLQNQGVNISGDYTIYAPGRARYSNDSNTPYRSITTGGPIDSQYYTRSINAEYMTKELDGIPAPAALPDLVSHAEYTAQALKMVRAQRAKFIKDARMLKSLLEPTFLHRKYTDELEIKYL